MRRRSAAGHLADDVAQQLAGRNPGRGPADRVVVACDQDPDAAVRQAVHADGIADHVVLNDAVMPAVDPQLMDRIADDEVVDDGAATAAEVDTEGVRRCALAIRGEADQLLTIWQ